MIISISVYATRGRMVKVQGGGGKRKTSHAMACTTKAGVGGTRWKGLKSSEREGRRVCSVRAISAVLADEREDDR